LKTYAANHNGKYPDLLDELVPSYLKSDTLIDSEQGKPFEYRGKGKDATTPATEVVVYSPAGSTSAFALFKGGLVVPMTRDRLARAVAEPPKSGDLATKARDASENQVGAQAAQRTNLLTWANLVDHPERWPAETKLTVPLRFGTGILRAGTSVRVQQVTAKDATVLAPQGFAFGVRPNECDLLEDANAFWSTLTPEQRAVDAATLANDASLWPDIVKTKLTLTFDLAGGQTKRLPAGTQCVFGFYDGEVACASPVGEDAHLEFRITDLDLIERARERALIDPAKRQSRIVQAIRSVLVDADGKPYANPSLEGVKAFVFFYGANWCGYCHQFSPYLVKFANENFSQASPVMFVLLDGDDKAAEMLAYMKSDKMPWPAIRKATWKKTFFTAVPRGFPHLLITDHYGRVLYDGGGGGESGIKQHLEALRKLRASIPGGSPKETDTAFDTSIATRDAKQPNTAEADFSPREGAVASASQTVVEQPIAVAPVAQVDQTPPEIRSTSQGAANPAEPVAQVAQASPSPQVTHSAPTALQAQPPSPSQPAEVKWLDPAVVVNDCMRVYRDARNAVHTQLNGRVFEQRYRGQRVKFSGVVDAVKKVEGTVIFKGAGKWPENYHVQADFPPDKMSVLDKLQRGQRLDIEADLSGFMLPQLDTGIPGIMGPSRTITLSLVTVLNQ
jgi:thiol-disulfide isomerase/thioredoxin